VKGYRELHRWDSPKPEAKPLRDNHLTGRRPPPWNKGKTVPRVEPNPGRPKRCISVAKKAEAERMPPASQRWRHPAFQKRHTIPVERRGNTFRALITSGVLRVLTREELVQLKGGEVRSCSGKFYRCGELERLESGRDRCGWYGDMLKRREKIPTRCDDCVRLKGK
jgi:hypothetical protein